MLLWVLFESTTAVMSLGVIDDYGKVNDVKRNQNRLANFLKSTIIISRFVGFRNIPIIQKHGILPKHVTL